MFISYLNKYNLYWYQLICIKKIATDQETVIKILIEIRDQGKFSIPTVSSPRNIENKSNTNSPEINQKQTEHADSSKALNNNDDKINSGDLSSLQQIAIYKYASSAESVGRQ